MPCHKDQGSFSRVGGLQQLVGRQLGAGAAT